MTDYQNILVINLMHLGDLMLVTPVLRTLRTNYPKARISLLADEKLGDIVRYNRHIDECLLIDKKGRDDHADSFFRFILGIREKHFDLVINLHRNERASAIAAFSGAGKIVGYSKPGFSLFFDKVLPNPSIAHHVPDGLLSWIGLRKNRYVPGWKHQVHAHFDVLQQGLGITTLDDGGLEMWLSEEMEHQAEALWREKFSPEDKVVAFNIGASWKTKRWLDASFAQCADLLLEDGYGIAFLGGPMDREIVENCISQMKHKDSRKLNVFTGRVGLGVLGGILERCVLFLTTDSGPMHVGVAMNVPIVTMFGASPVPGFYPYDGKDILLRSPEPCQPCGIHECPRQGDEYMACMKRISVETVMYYVRELLEQYHEPAMKIPRNYGQYQCRVVELK